MELTEKFADIAKRHTQVSTKEGWVDCTCGWQSNHPLLPTKREQAALEDPNSMDPSDRTGEPDPDHLYNEEPWVAHVAALRVAAIEEQP